MGVKDAVPPRCPWERMIRPWRDGELEAKPADEVARHLSVCGTCAALVRADREILELIRAGAPSFPGRPIALDLEEVLLEAERARREEAALVIALRRVAAAAAVVLLASSLFSGWSSFSSMPRKAEAEVTTIRAMAAIPSPGMALINDENSVMIAITRR